MVAVSTAKPGVSKRNQTQQRNEDDGPADTKLVVTEAQYSDGDVVPMDDGLYEAVGPSRPLRFNLNQFVTIIRRSDIEAWR